MRISIEFKATRHEGHLWYRITPKIEGTPTQRTLFAGIILAALTIGAFSLAGSVAPDPNLKPSQTIVMGWGH